MVAADTAADIGRLSRWTLRIATADCTPRARLSISPSQIAPGQSATLDASRSVSTVLHGITQYEYDYDDGSHVFTNGTAVQSHTFTRHGAHTVIVRVSDAHGVIGTAPTTLIVSSPPVAVFSPVGLPRQGGHRSQPERVGLDRLRRNDRQLRLGHRQRRRLR